jgi:hypothetical protein
MQHRHTFAPSDTRTKAYRFAIRAPFIPPPVRIVSRPSACEPPCLKPLEPSTACVALPETQRLYLLKPYVIPSACRLLAASHAHFSLVFAADEIWKWLEMPEICHSLASTFTSWQLPCMRDLVSTIDRFGHAFLKLSGI